MNSSQQVSDYIFFYPNVMDKKTCEAITTSYEKTAMWHKSTFYDGKKDTGTSQVAMQELWINNEMPYFEELKKSFAILCFTSKIWNPVSVYIQGRARYPANLPVGNQLLILFILTGECVLLSPSSHIRMSVSFVSRN